MSDRLKPLSQICSAIRVIPIRPGFVVFTVLKMNEKKKTLILETMRASLITEKL